MQATQSDKRALWVSLGVCAAIMFMAGSPRAARAQVSCGRREAVADSTVVVDTDRFAGTVSYCTGPYAEAGDLSLIWYWLRFAAADSNPSVAPPVQLAMSYDGPDWRYLDDHHFALLIDGSYRADLGDVSHRGSVGDGYVIEFMHTAVDRGLLDRIANAKKVEFRLGTTQGALSASDLASVRAIAKSLIEHWPQKR